MPYDREKHEAIGEALRSVRKANGLSQHQAARKLGVDRSYVSQVETGSKSASARLLSAMEEELGWDISEARSIGPSAARKTDSRLKFGEVTLGVWIDADGECRRTLLTWDYLQGREGTDEVTLRLIPARDRSLVTMDEPKGARLSFRDGPKPRPGPSIATREPSKFRGEFRLHTRRRPDDLLEVTVSRQVDAPGQKTRMRLSSVPRPGVHTVVQEFLDVDFLPPAFMQTWGTVFVDVHRDAFHRLDFYYVAGMAPGGDLVVSRMSNAEPSGNWNDKIRTMRIGQFNANPKSAIGVLWLKK